MANNKEKTQKQVKSFSVSDGKVFGDMLSAESIQTRRKLKIGLVQTGYFEYWPMYPQLKSQIEADSRIVYERLSKNHNIIFAPIADTMDAMDRAGRMFKDEQIDLLIMAYRTYVPDMFAHQMLSHIPDVPLLFFASQSRDKIDFDDDYCGVLRNCGLMAEIQLVGGFKKMGKYENRVEVIAGSIYDDQAYQRIERYIDVVTIWENLKTMTMGIIGHVFRGMFDFEYDKTKVKGTLGPEVMNVSIDLLQEQYEKATLDDADVQSLIKHAKQAYTIEGIGEDDLQRAARLGVALMRLVRRLRLDGVAVLGQHYIEKTLKTTAYLGLNELHREGKCPGVTEGDVIGLIMMKIMYHLTGNSAFLLEWSEFDVEKNAWMLLGHGFGDPGQARNDEPRLTPSAEMWGLEGTGVSGCFSPKPGACTMAHFIEDTDGWRMFISPGEILDLPPLPINDVHAIVKVQRPIKEYVELLTKAGWPHHAITVRGDICKELEQLAELMGMPVMKL